FARGTVACTGTEFCKLALTETKGFAARLVEDLEARLPGFDEHVKIHVTGCPNSCGQHWIADIGLEGKKVKVDGRLIDAYYFCVGGAAGGHAAIARPVGYRVPVFEVAPAIERLVRAYLAQRLPGERFRAFCARHDAARAGRISHRRRAYRDGDLAGFALVFVATGDAGVNAAVAAEGRRRGVWVNAADDPAHCDFILPAIVRRGSLAVAVSTGGAS